MIARYLIITGIVTFLCCVIAVPIAVYFVNRSDDKAMEVKTISIVRDAQVITELDAEFAVTSHQRKTGLMHRKTLADGKGMLFVFPSSEIQSFWMKNTSIPLTIAYVNSNRVITEFHDLTPFNETPVLSKYPSRYALEVPQGWFDRVGVQIGDRLSW